MRSQNKLAVEQAQGILGALEITRPEDIDVELIAAHHRVYVKYRTLTQQEGHLLKARDVSLLVVNDAALTTNKWRFVIAHELGHFFLHPEHDQFHVCTQRDIQAWYYTSGLEQEANDFAAELLMPRQLFKTRCDEFGEDDMPTLFHLSELASIFRTSLTATALRFIQFTTAPAAIVHATHGRIDWCVSSPGFALKVRPRTMLGRETYARALFEGFHIPNEPLPTECHIWSKTRGCKQMLFEHSIMLKEFNATMTLLWHEPQNQDQATEPQRSSWAG